MLIKYCMLRRRRSLPTDLRLGILLLHLETGRFRNKKVEDRKCLICNLQYVENEKLRNNLYLTVENAEFHGLSNENKLVHLIKHKWRELSIFIEKSWVKRTAILYNCDRI